MRKIVREEMQKLLNGTAKKCGRSMVDHLRFRLRSVFELAMSEGVTDRNPAIALYTPRSYRPGRERRVLASNEMSVMANALGLREHVIFRLGTWEGMRPGEIVGLQLRDFEGDCVCVRRRLYRGKTDDPKTKRSTRQVALTERTKALLEEWIQKSLITKEDAWLIPSEIG